MVALFNLEDLEGLIDATVTTGRATVVEKVVWGWLKPKLGWEERPAEIPPEVFSWAVELGAIAHENPAGLSSYQLGQEQSQYSAERRNEILNDAAAYGDDPTGTTGGPIGNFPPATPYPDPAR